LEAGGGRHKRLKDGINVSPSCDPQISETLVDRARERDLAWASRKHRARLRPQDGKVVASGVQCNKCSIENRSRVFCFCAVQDQKKLLVEQAIGK
jgi:hypothetical protein